MYLSDIFEALSYGELNKLAIAERGVKPEDYPVLISHINMALTDMYTRAPLLTRSLTLQLQEATTFYWLNSRHALTNTESTDVKYIIDSEYAPFLDDIITLTGAVDEYGDEIPLNDVFGKYSIFTPACDMVQVPYTNPDMAIFLEYQARHATISKVADIATTQVFLPAPLMPALLAYVGYRVFASRNGEKDYLTASSHMSRYLNLMAMYDSVSANNRDDRTSNIGIQRGGWC